MEKAAEFGERNALAADFLSTNLRINTNQAQDDGCSNPISLHRLDALAGRSILRGVGHH